MIESVPQIDLAEDFTRDLDPAFVMSDAGLDPDDWQRNLLRSPEKRHLLLCSRQSGKSTVCAAKALHAAIYNAPALILLISPSLRQSAELFRKVTDLRNRLKGVPQIASESVLRMELKNGSRIVALPGSESTIRGYSGASLIIADEAARISDELFGAVRPMLAISKGSMIALSTPAGCRGWFYESWTSASQGWKRTKITADQCPRIDPAWLEDERNLVGEFIFKSEYLCEFVDSRDQVFPTALIEAALSSEVLPLWP